MLIFRGYRDKHLVMRWLVYRVCNVLTDNITFNINLECSLLVYQFRVDYWVSRHHLRCPSSDCEPNMSSYVQYSAGDFKFISLQRFYSNFYYFGSYNFRANSQIGG